MRSETQQGGSVDPKSNRLLAMLASKDYEAVIREASIVSLKLRKRLHSQDKAVDAVYFPVTCMISLLVTSNDKPRMELATIGREGVVGASELIQGQGSMGLTIVQIPGDAVRIESGAFQELVRARPAFSAIVHRHMFALLRQVLYGASCNRIHSMEERCARWLLMTRDRADQNTFPLTQEFLSHMLGVRRATVNVATGMLKKAGFIHYVRGKLTIIDRPGLESASCACYKAIGRVYDTVLSNSPKVL